VYLSQTSHQMQGLAHLRSLPHAPHISFALSSPILGREKRAAERKNTAHTPLGSQPASAAAQSARYLGQIALAVSFES
jgi:hypothetical protein